MGSALHSDRQFLPCVCNRSEAARTVWPQQCPWISCTAQTECGAHPSGLALQLWDVVFCYQQGCFLLPRLELLLLDLFLPRDLR